MLAFLKELWTTFPALLKVLLIPLVLGVGWLGYRLTAPDPQVVARVGQLEALLARSLERAVGRNGKVLFSDLRASLRQLQGVRQYESISAQLNTALAPTQLSAADLSVLRLLKEAKPQSFQVLSLGEWPGLVKQAQQQLPVVKRRPFCTDATVLEPQRDCPAGVLASLLLARQRTAFGASLPRLIWPMLPQTFACGVGLRKLGNRPPVFHDAIDMGAPIGKPLVAMADGKVAEAGMGGACGYYIKITYKLGYKSLYCHMNTPPLKQKGQRVKQGELVGYVGTTGRSTGPHLHLRIHQRIGKQWKLMRDPIKDIMLCR